MYPIKFTVNKYGVIYFWYDQEEWNTWVTQGKKTGDVGAMLISREGVKDTYKIFGTLENPCTTMSRLTLIHNPLLDGPRRTPEQLCDSIWRKQEETRLFRTAKRGIIIMDLSNI